jgi:hypothetical protein
MRSILKGYRPDATLDPVCAARMGRIIEATDGLGMVVIILPGMRASKIPRWESDLW